MFQVPADRIFVGPIRCAEIDENDGWIFLVHGDCLDDQGVSLAVRHTGVSLKAIAAGEQADISGIYAQFLQSDLIPAVVT